LEQFITNKLGCHPPWFALKTAAGKFKKLKKHQKYILIKNWFYLKRSKGM
jgi:hypothetical protein